MKRYSDERQRPHTPVFKAGDFVQIKLWGQLWKSAPAYSAPVKVEKETGTGSYGTMDGLVWATKLLTGNPQSMSTQLLGLPTDKVYQGSRRITHPPSHYQP